MKKILLFFGILLAVGACKKSNSDPAPDPAAAVAGTYSVSKYAYDSTGTTSDYSYNLPYTVGTQTLAIVLTVKNTSTNTATVKTVDISGTTKITGQPDDSGDLVKNVEVRQSGSSYEFFQNSTSIGTADGTNLTLKLTSGAESLQITAKKQ